MKTRNEFEALLTKYNNAYRKGESLISDLEFDGLVLQYTEQYRDVQGLEFIKSLRDTVVDKKRKEKLPVMMTSLDKCKSVEEVQKWIFDKTGYDGVNTVITPKYDGISLLVDEVNSKCWTKGVVSEQEGQRSDKHFLAMKISSVPRLKFTIGEAIMRRSYFNTKYSKGVGGKYSHPRNMVAGLFNANEPSEALADVDYITYGYPRGYCMDMDKRSQVIELSIPYVYIANTEELTQEFLSTTFYNWKERLGFDIDGLVIDIDEANLREQCSDMASGNVGYAVAYKDPSWSQKIKTTLKSIEGNVSKQGKIKPVAVIDSVDVDGVEVSRVTVTNMRTVQDLQLYPGCSIEIKRSGEVIPKIVGVHNIGVPQRDECEGEVEFLEKWRIMKQTLNTSEIRMSSFDYWTENFEVCPMCGGEVYWEPNTKAELICRNLRCFGRLLSKNVYFFETLGIEGFGEPSISQIMNELEIISPYRILNLIYDDFLQMRGWGETSINNLLTQFNKIKTEGVSLARLLTALDLFEGKLAEKTCQSILDNIDIEELNQVLQTEESAKEVFEKLKSIKGVSSITAQAFYNGYSEYFHHYMVRPFHLEISYIQTPKTEVKSTRFSTQQICFTGFRNKEWEKVVIENGGKVVDGVSKNTTILVVKDLSSTSSKMKKAQELGVRVLSEVDFELRLKGEGLLN